MKKTAVPRRVDGVRDVGRPVLSRPERNSNLPSVAIDADDIGGVVRGPKGPEAGVWVIAETRDLPVRYIKSVVTDDQGRFVVPDLPAASYSVWARGYGLVDSDKTTSEARADRQHHREGRRRTRPRPRTTTRQSTGTRC